MIIKDSRPEIDSVSFASFYCPPNHVCFESEVAFWSFGLSNGLEPVWSVRLTICGVELLSRQVIQGKGKYSAVFFPRSYVVLCLCYVMFIQVL